MRAVKIFLSKERFMTVFFMPILFFLYVSFMSVFCLVYVSKILLGIDKNADIVSK
jgi:hypothetical protein